MHYLNESAFKAYKDGGCEEVEIYAANDERTCEICGTKHGKKYKIDKRPILPFHPNCRCTYLPVINTNNIENSQYLRIVNEKLVNKNDLKAIENDLSMLPESHRKILNEYVKEIRVVKTGNSSFNRITGVVTILEGMEEGELIHELGHALETKFDLKNNIEYEQLLQNLVKNKNNSDIIYDIETFNRSVYVLNDDRLISYYQGRMYESAGIFEEDMMTINIKSLGEYFSEGYREYIVNPSNLRNKDINLYNFIKELI